MDTPGAGNEVEQTLSTSHYRAGAGDKLEQKGAKSLTGTGLP